MEDEGGPSSSGSQDPSNPAHAGFGGHTVIAGAGSSGRFSGVEAIKMGQTNVRGQSMLQYILS